MQAFGERFTYNGKSSEDFDLILVNVGTEEGSSSLLSRQSIHTDMTQSRPKINDKGTKYSNVLSFPVSLIKKDKKPLEPEEIRSITTWLTGPRYARPLNIIAEGTRDEIYDGLTYYGKFVGRFDFFMVGNTRYGFTCNFECNAPYPYLIQSFNYSSASTQTINLNNTSDELEIPLYPTLTITPHSDGLISIDNKTDALQDPTTLRCFHNNTVTIDCNRKIITDSLGNPYDFQYFNLTWFELLPGNNDILLSGNFDLKITCEFPRKVGV